MTTPVEIVQAELKKIRDAAASAEQMGEVQARLQALEQEVVGFRDRDFAPTRAAIMTPGARALEEFKDSAAFAHVAAWNQGSARAQLEGMSLRAMVRGVNANLVGEGWGTTNDGEVPQQPQRRGMVPEVLRPLRLLDVLPTRPAATDSVEFIQMNSTGDAGEQDPQGSEKAEIAMDGVLKKAEIATIAAWLPASRQVLDDHAALSQLIDRTLRYKCLAKLETLLVHGGQGSHSDSRIVGLLEQSIEYDPSVSSEPADVIGEAAVAMMLEGYSPDVIVLNPFRWHSMRITREYPDGQDGQGSYLLSVPTAPVRPGLWTIVVVQSPQIGVNESVLLDTAHLDVLDRQRPGVMVSNSHADFFTRNLIAALGELRAGLEVRDVRAVRRVEFGTDHALVLPE